MKAQSLDAAGQVPVGSSTEGDMTGLGQLASQS